MGKVSKKLTVFSQCQKVRVYIKIKKEKPLIKKEFHQNNIEKESQLFDIKNLTVCFFNRHALVDKHPFCICSLVFEEK